jgi:DNA-binding XRE family transcriptional regulator
MERSIYICKNGGIMDCNKVGKLILGIRKEKGLTQKQLADAMNISDKTYEISEEGVII